MEVGLVYGDPKISRLGVDDAFPAPNTFLKKFLQQISNLLDNKYTSFCL